MSTYQSNQSRTLSASEIQEFRDKVNALCLAENGYYGKLFGNELEILEAYDAPLYQASLKTQHDKRTLHFTTPAPTSTHYTPRVPDPSMVDVTQVAPYPTRYTSAQESIEIEGSRQSYTCTQCGGQGTERCGRCEGKGEVTVESDCPSCSGRGYVTGSKTETYWVNADGSGNYTSGGQGRQMRQRSVPVHTPCTRCNGKGKLYHQDTCPRCHGRGHVTCGTCRGTGMLVHSIEMLHEQYVAVSNRYKTPDILSDNDTAEFCKVLNNTTSEWQLRDRYDIPGTSYASCPGNSLPVVGRIVGEVTSAVRSTVSDRVCFNTLSVMECKATAIRYRVDDKNYTAVMYGNSNTLFIATSPISDYFNKLRDTIEQTSDEGGYGRAWYRLKQLLNSSQANEHDRRAFKQLEARLEETALLGNFVGLAIAMILAFPPLVYYFAFFNIVAPWTDIIYHLMYTPVTDSAVRALLGLGIAFWLTKDGMLLPKYTWQQQSGALRFTLGLLNGIATMIVCTLAICVANYLGILHFAMLVVLFFLAILSIAINIIIAIIMLIAHLIA